MKNAQATIRDLALQLNVSVSTISRALQGHQDIKPKTKKAVLDLPEKLNYEPITSRKVSASRKQTRWG